MNSLEKQSMIKIGNLDKINYFQSILIEGYRLKLLDNSEIENIQLQSINLLAEQVERYTCGESSSVKIETAQNIFQSILYSIGIYLKSLPDTELCITVLKEKTLSELYQCGKKLIKIQFDNAKELLHIIQNDCIITDNYAYNDTIQNGISQFFSNYDMVFAAHDTPGSIDYPLSNDKMDLVGIEYIYNYLQNLYLENQFCKKFNEYDIECLLRGYNNHYQELLINIFELVLVNSIGSILSNKSAAQLNIEELDRQYLKEKLENLTSDKFNIILQNVTIRLFQELDVTDLSLQEYIKMTIGKLSVRLRNDLANNQLESVFVSLKEKDTQSNLQFRDGKKLNDELFRKIADEIRECRYVSDKVAIIQREIHSITDLVDILEGECIFDNEFYEVFKSLENMELAVILSLLSKDSTFRFSEEQKEWHKKLKDFMMMIDSNRREKIKILSKRISLI